MKLHINPVVINNYFKRSRLFFSSTTHATPLRCPPILHWREITSDPLNAYKQFAQRIEQDGGLAPIPEFKPVVEYLQETLESKTTLDFVNGGTSSLKQTHHLACLKLFHLKFRFQHTADKHYPHVSPHKAPYPYLPSLHAIFNALEFMDLFVREHYNPIAPLYHTDRYYYHLNHAYKLPTTTNGAFFYLPVTESLTLDDFINLRAAPIGLLGVAKEPIFADGYYNSPFDFLIHDANHIRRLDSYNRIMFKSRLLSPQEAIFQSHELIKEKVLKGIKIDSSLTKEETTLRKCMRVLYFELLHEYAFAFDEQQLKQAYSHLPDDPSPFEHMVDDTFDEDQLEVLRLPNKNLRSGFSEYKKKNSYFFEEPTIRYFMDKGPCFITSAYNKLNNGFYDTKYHRDLTLPPMNERTPEIIAKAALRIADTIFSDHPYRLDTLIAVIQSKKMLEVYPNNDLKLPEYVEPTPIIKP